MKPLQWFLDRIGKVVEVNAKGGFYAAKIIPTDWYARRLYAMQVSSGWNFSDSALEPGSPHGDDELETPELLKA